MDPPYSNYLPYTVDQQYPDTEPPDDDGGFDPDKKWKIEYLEYST